MPVFIWHDDKLLSMYDRTFIDAAQTRFQDLPRLTQQQQEALDLIDTLSYNEELKLDMNLEPGDIQLLHNHHLWHARSEYIDHDNVEKGEESIHKSQKLGSKRHLLRLWLSTAQDGWKLPEVFEERYGPLNGSVRGGISVPDVEPCTPLIPSYIQNQ